MRFLILFTLVPLVLLGTPLWADDLPPSRRAVFHADAVQLGSGEVLAPVEISYQTWGTLNADKSNVMFVCPEFRSLGDVAGPVPGIQATGQLEGLVGPGKLFDTDKLFIVSSDGLGCPRRGPTVACTGPFSTNPKTGKPYGMTFPIYTVGDMALLHRQLLASLGITRVKILVGQSMGAWQTMEWLVAAPETVECAILIAADGRIQPLTSEAAFGLGIAQIMADPAWNGGDYYASPQPPLAGLIRAQWNLTCWTTSYDAMTKLAELTPDGGLADRLKQGLDPLNYSKHAETAVAPDGQMVIDPNAWIYRARAAILADPGRERGGYEAALERVKAKVLVIASSSDLLNPAQFSRQTVELLQSKGTVAEFIEVPGTGGHVGLCQERDERALFAPAIARFLGHEKAP